MFCGLAVLLAGLLANYFCSLEGKVNLQAGRSSTLSVADGPDSTSGDQHTGLDLILRLDSLTIHPHTEEYEVLLHKRDTSVSKNLNQTELTSYKVIGQYSLKPMRIRKIEKTDLRFRLKEFFPDFTFEYSYPENRDSIDAKAPGITLELNIDEEPTVVTLREDLPNRNKLDDVVNFGSSLAFYWDIPYDSIKSFSKEVLLNGNKIVFSGSNQKVYFLFNEGIEEQVLKEHTYYKIPGREGIGFTILYCFPDMAYLKAVPSSKSAELLNPVANMEIWKIGEGAREAFIYPEKKGRNGGNFFIPDSDYMLSLGISPQDAIKSCDCIISLQNKDGEILKSLTLRSGNSKSFHGYLFKPLACSSELQDEVMVKITHHPGNKLILFGVLLFVAYVCLMFINK